MKILLIYPKYPDTYWSFKHALKFISKKAANIPLGILTIASLLPDEWQKKLTDLNVSTLYDKDILWADYVMISAMSVQLASVRQIIDRCRQLQRPIIAGGPLFTEEPQDFKEVDHLILNEAELNLPAFIKDLEDGKPRRIYKTENYADITQSPVPDYSLLEMKHYAMAGIQFSRGCPYDCEFCDITALFGRKVRTKTTQQVIAELDNLYMTGWKGSVFFVDDNFIGHKKRLKNDLLPAIIQWMQEHDNPFFFTTEASIDLSDDEELMKLMIQAGFVKVFVGIETPDMNSLTECNKIQNNNRDLLQSIKKMQNEGMEITGGFIVGFDSDPTNIFQRQIDFIQSSGIITAMVGLLNAPRLSRLYKRLQDEGRILKAFSGDNTNYSMNFIPAMNREDLMNGYQRILREIYSSRSYYKRIKTFLKQYNPPSKGQNKINSTRLMAFFKSMLFIGVLKKDRRYYWPLIFWSLFRKPASFPLAVTYSIYGYHFRKVFNV
jgi:radical SAM superfamily enzyme YgiQ (UPF0313 family)